MQSVMQTVSNELCQAAAHVANMSRWRPADSPELIAARRRLIFAKMDSVRAKRDAELDALKAELAIYSRGCTCLCRACRDGNCGLCQYGGH